MLNRSALLALLGAYSGEQQETRIGAITDHRATNPLNSSALQRAFSSLARPQTMTAQRAPTPFYGGPPQAYQNNPYQPAQQQQQGNPWYNDLQTQNDMKNRYHYLPVNSVGTVAAGASQVCSTQPQALAFRPARIMVPASIAPDFTIDSIFCGIKPQFVATGSISAETFTQDARGCDMIMDVVTTSQNFTLNVTNQSGAARQFRATVFGDSADT